VRKIAEDVHHVYTGCRNECHNFNTEHLSASALLTFWQYAIICEKNRFHSSNLGNEKYCESIASSFQYFLAKKNQKVPVYCHLFVLKVMD
jgi:hypothetical protein